MTILFWVFFSLAMLSIIGFIVSMCVEKLRYSTFPALMSLSLSVCALVLNIINLITKL